MTATGDSASARLVRPGEVPLVYLDANILLPQYLRTVFLDLADAGLLRVHWGRQVLEEVRRNLLKPGFGRTAAQAERLLRLLAEAFPDALVLGSEALEDRFAGRTNPKDSHVAAGALKLSQATHGEQPVILVTSNTKHLPQSAFSGTIVRSVRPGTFLVALLKVKPEVAPVLEAMLKRFKAPVVSQKDFLTLMDNSGCTAFATALAKRWGFVVE